MKMTRLFSQTSREAPAEAEFPSHQLLIRAGYIRPLAAGIFSYLPLAKKTLTNIENIMREELDRIDGQEIFMPIVHPADIWQETDRWFKIGSEMGRFRDKNNRDMVLSMTHEEVISDLVRKEVRSYRQLPQLLYQIQTKWRDDPRPRGGLIRAREFTMLDSYSLDRDWEGLDHQYRAHYQAYLNIFHRCGLEPLAVKSDVGMMGGQTAHEFIYLSSIGEDTIMICDNCGYSANQQIAKFKKIPLRDEPQKATENIPTPGIKTIDDLSEFLDIPEAKTAKAIFMIATRKSRMGADEELVFCVVRGDMALNQTKLANVIKADALTPATEEEIRKNGAVPGYASPLGLSDVFILVDDLIPKSKNLVAGANIEGFHTLNVNYGRDFTANLIEDIVLAEEGHLCPNCEANLREVRGIEVGNIFKLGTTYSEAMGCRYSTEEGKLKPIVMGSYGIGSGRLLACIAEEYHDDQGLILPITIAPYQVHLIVLTSGSKKSAVIRGIHTEKSLIDYAEEIYSGLLEEGVDVLFDDRELSPGIKFADADLIGIPIRITVSNRSVSQDGIELKLRNSQEKLIIPFAAVSEEIKKYIYILTEEILTRNPEHLISSQNQ